MSEIPDSTQPHTEPAPTTGTQAAAGRSPLSGSGYIDLGPDDEATFAQDADNFIEEHGPYIAQLYNSSQVASSEGPEPTPDVTSPEDQEPDQTSPTLDLGGNPPRPPRPPRPPSPPQPPAPTPPGPAGPTPPRRSHVEDWGFALTRDEVEPPLKSEDRVYPPDRHGNVIFTKEFFGLGDTISSSALPESRREDRRILIRTANGDEYYLYNDRVYDLQRSRDGEMVAYSLRDHSFPDITIGEGWDLGIRGLTADVDSVEVFTAKMPRSEAAAQNFFGAENAGNMRNRFTEMEGIINHTIPTYRHDPSSAPTRGERLREVSGRAWETGKRQAVRAGNVGAEQARWLTGALRYNASEAKSVVTANARRLSGRIAIGAQVMLEVHNTVIEEARQNLEVEESDTTRGQKLRAAGGKVLNKGKRQASRASNAGAEQALWLRGALRYNAREARSAVSTNARRLAGRIATSNAVATMLNVNKAVIEEARQNLQADEEDD